MAVPTGADLGGQDLGGRENYTPAAEALLRFADAEPARLADVSDELLAVAGLLRREPRLRRALVDNSRSGEDRAELLRSVLGDKISDDAQGLLAPLVAARWPTAVSLLDATERLAVDTLLTGVERTGQLGDVEDELFRFGQVAGSDPGLAGAFGDSSVELPRRVELARDLLGGKVGAATLRLVELALAGFGGRGFTSSLGRLVELAAGKRERSVAYVTAAVALTDDEEQRLAARLAELYGREVSLKVQVDESIIGGVRVRVGSDLYDGTVARRLAEVRTALAK